jgi:MoaA/NifB/PqqE/SkfB family radical SAM enzyme
MRPSGERKRNDIVSVPILLLNMLFREMIHFHLDAPADGSAGYSRFVVSGWILPPSRVKSVKVIAGRSKTPVIARYGVFRADVERAYQKVKDAAFSGFEAVVQVGDDERDVSLDILAELASGKIVRISQRTVKNTRDVLKEPPREVHVGLITRCNLKCRMCPAHADTTNPDFTGEKIDPLLLENVYSSLREIGPHIERIDLTDFGEPFLYPEIFSVTRTLRQICPNVRIIAVTTNGFLLTDEMIKKILGSPITEVTISFDAATSDTYESVRTGGDFRRLVENTRRFVELRNQAGGNLPRIHTNFVLMESNADELNDYIKLVSSLGVDHIGVVNEVGLFSCDRDGAKLSGFLSGQTPVSREIRETISRAFDLAREKKVSMSLPRLDPLPPGLDCVARGRVMPFITPDGSVYPCCVLAALSYDGDKTIQPMGTIPSQSLKEIWDSKEYTEFREAFYRGVLPHRICRSCCQYYGL